MSFGELARKAGFTSRGYLYDIVAGRKRVSAKALPRFIRAFGLAGDRKLCFQLLVILEEPDLRDPHLTELSIRAKISDVRSRISRSLQDTESLRQRAANLFHDHAISRVYAAMTMAGSDASLRRVAKLADMETKACAGIIDQLVASGFVQRQGDRFHSLDSHLVFDGLSQVPSFQQSCLDEVDRLKNCATHVFSRRDYLFLKSDFTVPKAKIPHLREELRQLLVRFVDETTGQAADDAMVTLLVGFMPQGDAVLKPKP